MTTFVTLEDYFAGYRGDPRIAIVHKGSANILLGRINLLLNRYAVETGNTLPINPATSSRISGHKNGGWRPADCKEGSATSSHKAGRGVDVYDPDNSLDNWLTDQILADFGLYREHPDDTHTWCHLTDRAPGSGKRTFKP